MELKIENLNLEKEKIYFNVALVISIVAWIFVTITIIGPVIGIFLAILGWLAHGLLVAQLKSSCVKIDSNQLPKLYENYLDVCKKLNVEPPELYVAQSGGLLNAFATRFSGRNFVVLYSDIVEAFEQGGDEIRFLFGHEIGHLKSKHSKKHVLLFPALCLPWLGPAYHRACEASCDRFGAFATNNMDGGIKALMVLSGGKNLHKQMDPLAFSQQFGTYRGFFVSWYELISGYPTLSQRVSNIVALKNDQPAPQPQRNPFSYIFALFSVGSGSSNMGGAMVMVAMIALLAAIAIPNLLRAKLAANDALAKATIKAMSTAAESYATANSGHYPASMIDLTTANPPFLNHDYCDKNISGYEYKCSFNDKSYEIIATPVTIGSTETTTLTITTGGVSG